MNDVFVRRGIALDMGVVFAYNAHEKLAQRLMLAYRAPPPPGYAKVTLSQIRTADEQFVRVGGEAHKAGDSSFRRRAQVGLPR